MFQLNKTIVSEGDDPNHFMPNYFGKGVKWQLPDLDTPEVGYIMAREAVYIRIILNKMGHKQPPTPIQTDNAMADAIINKTVQPKCTKAMDMRFHWLRDSECQHQFKFFWRPGKTNFADYWTKHHSAAHHVNLQHEFLTPLIVLEMLQQKHQQHHPAAA